ncbi:MAG TPA: energy transducer TonB [Bryobacteraceae bacterium]|nr:energy transducer TonB [Bryobacteraceae bacterium]
MPEQVNGAPGAPNDNPDIHLQRLLAPQNLEDPWFKTVFQGIKDVIHPPKLPPLEVTSRPVDPRELKGLTGLYGGNETKAGLGSVAIHCGVIALLFIIGSLKPVQNVVQQAVTPLFTPDLSAFKPKKQEMHGGGGGGAKEILNASKGKLPKIAPKQFTPPRVDPPPDPKLPMTPTIVADQPLPNIQANNYGDPLSKLGMSSNGIGSGGGIGSGKGGGVGPGNGAGFGPGSGGGFGNGAYRIGGGVSAPKPIYQPEPEYSEEARKAKWQGTVLLSLVVDEAGRAVNIKVTKSLGLGLDQKAIEAVEKWKFEPGKKDGKPVPVMATVEVNFRLL